MSTRPVATPGGFGLPPLPRAGAPSPQGQAHLGTSPDRVRSADAGQATQPPLGAPDADDALGATTRNLAAYQERLHGLLDTLTRSAALVTGPGDAPPPGGGATGAGAVGVGAVGGAPIGGGAPTGGAHPQVTPSGGPPSGGTAFARPGETPPTAGGPSPHTLFGGQLGSSATPRAVALPLATPMGDRSLTLPKGSAFTCALKTRVISANSGLVGCQVLRNVYGDDGRVLLVERGSHLDGEYRIASVRPGTVRIPVMWNRLRTPLGVVVDIASPATGPLGESGIEGHVDNRWGERLGAAMLLSLIDDSVKLVIQQQSNAGDGSTLVLPATTANTSRLAEKVLDSTINIPPLVYQNQGGVVGIYVARDLDFSQVYRLAPVPR